MTLRRISKYINSHRCLRVGRSALRSVTGKVRPRLVGYYSDNLMSRTRRDGRHVGRSGCQAIATGRDGRYVGSAHGDTRNKNVPSLTCPGQVAVQIEDM